MSAPHYQIIRRPIITEKGLGVKETQHTVVFEVSANATKTQIKEAVQQIFKVKSPKYARRILPARCAVVGRTKVTGAIGRKRT